MWQQWINGILGLWIILLTFLDLSVETMSSLVIITGVVIAFLGFWGAATSRREV